MRKIITKMTVIAMAMLMSLSFVGCGASQDPGIVDEPNTINVKIRKAGYGTTYITALADAFNETFKAQGYKVNVLAPKEDLVSTNVYRAAETSGVDVYFTSDVTAEKSVLSDFGQVFADITDSVYKKPAIKADGTEEDITIEEKFANIAMDMDNCFYQDKIYGLPYAVSVRGLAVNKRVLSEYDIELPRTTDELWKAADKIMEHAVETDTFPFTFSLTGNNYTNAVVGPWMVQAMGKAKFDSFYSFENEDGTPMTTDAYKVYAYPEIQDVLTQAYHFFDENMEAYGSASQDFSAAQGQVMKGSAVFMANGDWMFNEEFVRHQSYLNDVTFISTPVISTVGTKLFGAGTAYNFDAAKADSVLSTIIKYYDAHKTNAEIKAAVDAELSVNLNQADVDAAVMARSYIRSELAPGLVINNFSAKKDISALFLRFCASADGGRIFSAESHSTSPYSIDNPVDSDYAWIKSVNNIITNKYTAVSANLKGYRKSMDVTVLFPGLSDPYSTDLQGKVSKYAKNSSGQYIMSGSDSVYSTIASETATEIYNTAKYNVEHSIWKVK